MNGKGYIKYSKKGDVYSYECQGSTFFYKHDSIDNVFAIKDGQWEQLSFSDSYDITAENGYESLVDRKIKCAVDLSNVPPGKPTIIVEIKLDLNPKVNYIGPTDDDFVKISGQKGAKQMKWLINFKEELKEKNKTASKKNKEINHACLDLINEFVQAEEAFRSSNKGPKEKDTFSTYRKILSQLGNDPQEVRSNLIKTAKQQKNLKNNHKRTFKMALLSYFKNKVKKHVFLKRKENLFCHS